MEFKPIHAPTSTELFIDQLKTAILTGKYQPGEKLPSERQLEKQLCVSRPVINAGLKKLQDLHFVKIQPRNGVYIADYRSEGDLKTMNEIINFHGGHYRLPLLKSIYRVRSQIESDIIRLAASEKDDEALQKAYFAMQALINMADAQAQAAKYFEFIHYLSLASHNDVYPLLINNFEPIYLTLGKWTCEIADTKEFCDEYENLLKLIKEGNAEKAVGHNQQLIKASYQLLTT